MKSDRAKNWTSRAAVAVAMGWSLAISTPAQAGGFETDAGWLEMSIGSRVDVIQAAIPGLRKESCGGETHPKWNGRSCEVLVKEDVTIKGLRMEGELLLDASGQKVERLTLFGRWPVKRTDMAATAEVTERCERIREQLDSRFGSGVRVKQMTRPDHMEMVVRFKDEASQTSATLSCKSVKGADEWEGVLMVRRSTQVEMKQGHTVERQGATVQRR